MTRCLCLSLLSSSSVQLRHSGEATMLSHRQVLHNEHPVPCCHDTCSWSLSGVHSLCAH